MAADRWNDASSDLVDAAAILVGDLGAIAPSRGGYMVVSAREWDDDADFIEAHEDGGCPLRRVRSKGRE
jgi:hypothetical protein